MIIPNTNIKLLKVPLSLSNKHQLTFTTKALQLAYFNSLPSISLDDATYQRKDNFIRYEGNYDSLLQYNYVMYQNESYGNKWFFAFISNMVYRNDNRTDIYITTDVWQTWQFDIDFKQSFIEREMCNVSDDVPRL